MPEGVLHWFDALHGDAEVVRDGHAYHVPPGAVEAAARHPGARVHFDVERVNGVELAVGVRLRQSARGSRHRRRFGTLAGARRFDTKGRSTLAAAHPELHLAETHPLEVARSWATSLAQGDVTGALALYSADAVVHLSDRSLEGRAALGEWLESGPALGCGRHGLIHGLDDGAVVEWEPEGAGEWSLTVRCRIAHGEISEQWEGVEVPAPAAAGGGRSPVVLVTVGRVGTRAKSQAKKTVARVLEAIAEPVLFARLKLTLEPDPARPRPARAEVLLDVNGEPVRVRATGRTMAEAIDTLDGRLRDRLEHRASRRDDLRRSEGVVRPGEWRRGDLAPRRPPYFDRPVEERQLVRHKTFAVGKLTCDEAIFDMAQLDYDFYLFVDLDTGDDSVVERTDGGTYRVTRRRGSAVPLGPTAEQVQVSDAGAPVLELQEAIERLGASGERHLFFTDQRSGRGCVLYLRYDGHYGLITPE